MVRQIYSLFKIIKNKIILREFRFDNNFKGLIIYNNKVNNY